MEEITPKFKLGDVVQLKSGGPEMTVSELIMVLNMSTASYDKFTGKVKCQWFSNKERKEETFVQDTIEKIEL